MNHVESVMTGSIQTVSPDASVRAAARTMREHDVRSLFVPGADAGIVTSTDVLDVLADGDDPGVRRVEDVMTVPVESVGVEIPVQEAASMMTTYDINHLPVRNRSGDYVGMVSSSDLRDTFAETVTDG